MFEIEVDGKTRKAKVTFRTAVLYEAEFGSDLVKDFFGKKVFETEAEPEEADGKTVTIDFTQTDWTVVMKVLWAALKTADAKVPGFELWCSKAEGANLWFAAEALAFECTDCFFRPSAAGEEKEGE